MKRAMARQAEAERERRAKVIAAQGDQQASQTLADAAHTLSTEPAALQLRYLQTVTEIAAENNSTTLFPIPIELFRPFLEAAKGAAARTVSETPSLPLPQITASLPPGEAMPGPDLAQLMEQMRIESGKKRPEG
jgi:hypothetical protein